jgi:hypothetical protein
MAYTGLRIHPAIGIARVGSSEEYYLGPETMAGMPQPGDDDTTGGLPIRPGTEADTILSTELRDGGGRLKRQAARFRIYQYAFDDAAGVESYPAGAASEVQIGSVVDGKTVQDIVWTVHLANKKANSWHGGDGVAPFSGDALPPLRNASFGPLDSPQRLKTLVIDAGPRAVSGADHAPVRFDAATTPSYGQASGAIASLPDYPLSFPLAGEPPATPVDAPGSIIRALGAISTEHGGRLVVVGGYGKASSFDNQGRHTPSGALNGDVNNDNWFDDVADGPVTAILLFADGSTRAVEGGAWVIATDPAYAPQTANVVTLWDDLYCTWLEQFSLRTAVYAGGKYQPAYQTDFTQEIMPVLRAASLQKWTTSLPMRAVKGHDWLGRLTADGLQGFEIMNYLRQPDHPLADPAKPQMPLSLGDAGQSFLTLTRAQYFFMGQWSSDRYLKPTTPAPQLGAGEALDRTVLFNCLGGRFSPGIEMSFIVRDPLLYKQDWHRHDSGGPFRINAQPLDYGKAVKDQPFLGIGYTPLRRAPVQPGDLSKFMALPWHTDYNSCATHLPDPNPGGTLYNTQADIDAATAVKSNGVNTLLYSSWPAQRPVAVYTYDDVVANGGKLVQPRYSVRGFGTRADVPRVAVAATPDATGKPLVDRPPMHVGRYQQREQFLQDWNKIGVVLQSTAIPQPDDDKLPTDYYLEVASLFDSDESNLAEYWRNTVIDQLYPPPPMPKPKC